jgi:FkbM family methyltransferase
VSPLPRRRGHRGLCRANPVAWESDDRLRCLVTWVADYVECLNRTMRVLGYDIHRHDERDPLTRRLASVLQDLKIRHVIDVGGNIGQFALRIRRSGFRGRIDSFEPARRAFDTLSATAAADLQWNVQQMALSSSAGAASLHLHDDSSLNSLSQTTVAGDRLFESIGSRATTLTEDVRLARLDELDLPDVGPALLKLDTQGHDFEVIQGAGAVLDRCELLLIELSFVRLYTSSVPAPNALTRLSALGYDLVDLFPISRDEHCDLVLIEADGVFIRRG